VTMPKVTFVPSGIEANAEPGTKLLVIATKAKAPIRFGCASLRCGTCGVAVHGACSSMTDEERTMHTRLKLPSDLSVRMACRTRIESDDLKIDLDFQNTYSPDTSDEFE